MFIELMKQLKTAILLLFVLTILTGFLYPAMVTVIAQVFFPWKANGSLIKRANAVVGSALIGQYFTDPRYFWGRPSATIPVPYNAENSSGSNLGPTNPALISVVKDRIANLQHADPDNKSLIPVDLVTASGSGLDPDISPQAAYYQIHRIAKARNVSEETIKMLIDNSITYRVALFLGEPRVNVLHLNLRLDELDEQF